MTSSYVQAILGEDGIFGYSTFHIKTYNSYMYLNTIKIECARLIFELFLNNILF
jgi:hypothetical protein